MNVIHCLEGYGQFGQRIRASRHMLVPAVARAAAAWVTHGHSIGHSMVSSRVGQRSPGIIIARVHPAPQPNIVRHQQSATSRPALLWRLKLPLVARSGHPDHSWTFSRFGFLICGRRRRAEEIQDDRRRSLRDGKGGLIPCVVSERRLRHQTRGGIVSRPQQQEDAG